MKIRIGFVSNSSSSSFIAVGLGRYSSTKKKKEIFHKAIEILFGKSCDDISYEDLENGWYSYGIVEKMGFNVYTSDGEPWFLGMDLEDGIKKDKRLSEMKKELQKLFKDVCDIKVNLSDLDMEVGETCSG